MYCEANFDEVEDLEEANLVIEGYERTIEVLKKGYHILPSKIITIINLSMDDDGCGNLCFCKINKKGWRHRWEKERRCNVTLYTSNVTTIEEFISSVGGMYFGIKYSGAFEEYPYILPNKEYFKINISYEVELRGA